MNVSHQHTCKKLRFSLQGVSEEFWKQTGVETHQAHGCPVQLQHCPSRAEGEPDCLRRQRALDSQQGWRQGVAALLRGQGRATGVLWRWAPSHGAPPAQREDWVYCSSPGRVSLRSAQRSLWQDAHVSQSWPLPGKRGPCPAASVVSSSL